MLFKTINDAGKQSQENKDVWRKMKWYLLMKRWLKKTQLINLINTERIHFDNSFIVNLSPITDIKQNNHEMEDDNKCFILA